MQKLYTNWLAELSLRLPAPGSRYATLRANQSLEPTVMGLHASFACGKPTPAAQLRNRLSLRSSLSGARVRKQWGSEAQPINAVGDRQDPAQAGLGGVLLLTRAPVR